MWEMIELYEYKCIVHVKYIYISLGYIDDIEKVLLGEVVWVLKRLLGY
jgi:hypothetical protein